MRGDEPSVRRDRGTPRRGAWRRGAALLIPAVALGLGACGGSSGSSKATASSAASTTGKPASSTQTTAAATGGTSAGGAVTGAWSTSFTGNERFRALGHRLPSGTPPGGGATLTITPSQATLHLAGNGNTFPLGPTFRLAAHQMTFGADPSCPHNYPSAGTAGRYTYVVQGNTLTFRVVQDSCLDRIATLVAHPWRRG